MSNPSIFSQPITRELQAIFSETPRIVTENLKYLCYDPSQKHFTCLSCNTVITNTNLKVELITNNFNQHLNSAKHSQNTIPTSAIRKKLINVFKGKVPQIVKDNVDVISFSGNDFLCTTCNEIIHIASNLYETSNKFSCHFALKSHEANFEKHYELLSHLYTIFGGIPSIVLHNSEYLSKVSSAEYHCTACDHTLKIQPKDRKETEKEIIYHLSSEAHKRNAQQAKAYSMVPELDYIFHTLPNYILRNIEYISMNGSDFFCSLCNNNISFAQDAFETKHNFRVHFLLTDHEKRLKARMDLSNESFSMLESLFKGFPLSFVIDHLKYISFVENKFGCNICSEVIIDGGKEEDVIIRDALSSHCVTRDHESNIQCNIDQQSEILQDLDNLFGVVPQLIKNNIKHIMFKDTINFQCTLCSEPLKAKKNRNYAMNSSMTKDNFESHFNSSMHISGLEALECLEDEVKTNLESLYSHLPQFILSNMQHLGFNEGTNDYHCYLCDQSINVATGSNKSELTKQNLRFHLFSEDHVAQLKNQANNEQDCLIELESIFYKVPSVIVSGAEHLELQQDDSYYCNLCKVSMKRSCGYLLSHFHGRIHRSLLEDLECECTDAFYELDRRFWRVPESVIRNIGFLTPNGKDLFCIVCRDNLTLDNKDLVGTKNLLKSHMYSKKHKVNLLKN